MPRAPSGYGPAATAEKLIEGAENLLTIGSVTEPTLDEGENSSTTVSTISCGASDWRRASVPRGFGSVPR